MICLLENQSTPKALPNPGILSLWIDTAVVGHNRIIRALPRKAQCRSWAKGWQKVQWIHWCKKIKKGEDLEHIQLSTTNSLQNEWVAEIFMATSLKVLGAYPTATEAKAYDRAALLHLSRRSPLNFDEADYQKDTNSTVTTVSLFPNRSTPVDKHLKWFEFLSFSKRSIYTR